MVNHKLNIAQLLPAHRTSVRDVRLQYIHPKMPCDPCDVSYSISAAIDEHEYISVGFKGQSWEGKFPHPPEIGRPCYFGMCVDRYDDFMGDRIALGYASSSHGSCVREMAMNGNLVGQPTDVASPVLRDTSVTRHGGRTIVRFTASQRWPTKSDRDGPFRVMWAIGSLTNGNGCQAAFGYHGKTNKGVAPLNWLLTIGSTSCTYRASEMGEE